MFRTFGSPHVTISLFCFRATTTKSRLDEECAKLLLDIRRIGEPGEPFVLFGDLFDDDEVANYYEALVGTLKAAKKRGLISFQGQMLLKGPHDKVKISICE
jgi:Costars